MGSSSTITTTTINDQKPSMQRISKHLPTVIKTSPTTTYTTTRNMSLFPRFVENEFAPMFRLLDSYANHAVNNGRTNNGPFSSGFGGSLRSFSPKFDIKETDQTYELHGELPGIEQKNINIEFTDRQTLTIKGRTEHSREEGQRPAAFIEGEQRAQIEGGEKYQKPSVEDESATAMSGANPDASTTGEAAQETNDSSEVAKDEGRYWLSEPSRPGEGQGLAEEWHTLCRRAEGLRAAAEAHQHRISSCQPTPRMVNHTMAVGDPAKR